MTDKTIEQRARELLAEAIDRPPQFLDAMGDGFCFTKDEALRAIARALEQPEGREAVARKPDGYAYRYPSTTGEGTVIRFTCGQDINGSRAIEAVPYFYGTSPAKVPEVVVPELEAEWTMDCGGKQDYDADLVRLSTRYWPRGGGFLELTSGGRLLGNEARPEIAPSANATIYAQGEKLAAADFTGETEAEVKAQVEAWAREQWVGIYRKLAAAQQPKESA